jgi:predicted transcriptional regulator
MEQSKKELDISLYTVKYHERMKIYSSAQAARELGLTPAAITKYIKAGKIPRPKTMEGGNRYLWTEQDVEHVRKLLPKIANGRKTRYSKLKEKKKAQPRAAQSQHAKTARAGSPDAVPHKSRKPKKK